jgi:hypothetical protein
MIRKVLKGVMIGVLMSALMSCASSPQSTPITASEEVQKIKKMAVVTSLSGEGADISHHRGLTANPYAAPFGLLGLLIGSAVEKAAIRASLSSYENSLKKGLADYSPKKILDEAFCRLFVTEFAVVNPVEVEKAVVGKFNGKASAEANKPESYDRLVAIFCVDSVLEIDFQYGLEVHGETLSAAVINADLKLTRLSDKAVVLNKHIASGKIAKTWYRVDEFAKDDAKLYKSELSNACEAIVYLTALELGANPNSTGRFYWQRDAEN